VEGRPAETPEDALARTEPAEDRAVGDDALELDADDVEARSPRKGRGSELRRTAVARGGELAQTAAARGEELRRTAAVRGGELAQTAAARGEELRRTAAARGGDLANAMRDLDVPWARCRPARYVRETILQFGLWPMIDFYARARVRGRERFDDVKPPVVLVANHSSHLDTPVILRALPLKWRQRTAVAAAADYFYKKRAVANAIALVFNTVPLLRRGGGSLDNGAFDHVDRLLKQRWNLLIYPEGTRSRDGRLGKVRSGAAVIARNHGIPIVPVRLRGTHAAMPPGQNWPKRVAGKVLRRRHTLEVEFGAPIWVQGDEPSSETMRRVRAFLEDRDDLPPTDDDGTTRATEAPEPAGEGPVDTALLDARGGSRFVHPVTDAAPDAPRTPA